MDKINREFMKFKENNKNIAAIDKKNIGSFLLPYLSPIPAKKGFEKSLTNTDNAKIIAILRESNPL